MASRYLNMYMGNPTAGGTDGTLISVNGSQSSPLTFSLDAATSESKTAAVALRCASGYETTGDVVISATGTNAEYWSFSATENGTYTSTLTISSTIGAVNHVIYVKAASASTESPNRDTSVFIRIQATVAASS